MPSPAGRSGLAWRSGLSVPVDQCPGGVEQLAAVECMITKAGHAKRLICSIFVLFRNGVAVDECHLDADIEDAHGVDGEDVFR